MHVFAEPRTWSGHTQAADPQQLQPASAGLISAILTGFDVRNGVVSRQRPRRWGSQRVCR